MTSSIRSLFKTINTSLISRLLSKKTASNFQLYPSVVLPSPRLYITEHEQSMRSPNYPFHLPSGLSLPDRAIRASSSLDGATHERTGPWSRQDQSGLDQWGFVRGLWKMLPKNKMPFSGQDKISLLELQFLLLAILQLWKIPVDRRRIELLRLPQVGND